jgi:hypothetical protein
MEVLAKESIEFRDWEGPVRRTWVPVRERRVDGDGSGGQWRSDARITGTKVRDGKNGREEGHVTVQIPRRPLPGQQEGVTYQRYYRT